MKCNFKKVLFGLSVSLVLAMAIGSFALSETQTPANTQLETQSVAASNDDTGNFAVSGEGGTISFVDPLLTIDGGSYTISMEEGVTSNSQRIELKGGATVTLDGVTVDDTTDGPALTISGSQDVTILIADGSKNVLTGKAGSSSDGTPGAPGIQKTDSASGRLIIGVPENSEEPGELEATGGYHAAGIGGGNQESGSNITISGGTVTATGGSNGAGIGGGPGGSGSNITITGGTVTATGGSKGAGIGGGNGRNGTDIKISGGTVTATGEYSGAGIGGGENGDGKNIEITGGTVTATGDSGAGIGGGAGGNGTGITISGGTVTATGGSNGAGIGGGPGGSGSDIKISGGTVTATGGEFGGAGIGGGNYGSGSNNSIDGDNVVVIAKNGDASKAALEGFGTTIGKGLIFTKQGSSGNWNYTMNNSVEISGDVEIPTSFTVPNGFTIKNKANLTFAGGANITCDSTGKVETLLKYNPQGGSFSGLDDAYQLYQDSSGTGKSYTNLPTPTTNAIFNGWNKKADGTGAKLSESTVDLNLHQAYADMNYTVTFDSQGGSDVSPVSPIKYKSKVTKPTDPTREGYTFDTWYKEESCTNKWDFDKDTVQGDTTLYAGWTADPTPTPPTPTPPTPTPSVIVPVQPDNGNIEVLTQDPEPGDTVIFTVTPDEGYQVKGLPKAQILRQSFIARLFGNDIGIDVQSLGDNKYSFVMPNDNVVISAELEQIPTPTPPGPEPGPEPTPTPEPTPDPSVDPDGGDGSGSSGSSSKTGDSFMGGMALALLGVATTGAILTRKLR